MAIGIGKAKARVRTNLWSGRKYIQSPRTNTMVKSNRVNQQMSTRQRAQKAARQEAVRNAYRASARSGMSVKALAQNTEPQQTRVASSWDETRKKFKASR